LIACLLPVAAGVIGCNQPADNGVVMAAFGLINQTVPGQGVVPDQVVTNLYFGGCSPSDPGMQIIERVTADAAAATDPTPLLAASDADCNARLTAYTAIHPEVALPLSCQTFFVAQCPGLGADVTEVAAPAVSVFQGGGPADRRIALTGTVTLNVSGTSVPVPATGIADVTFGPCTGAGQSCPITVSRFDFTSNGPFTVSGVSVDSAQVQSQGLAHGQQSATEFLIPANAIEAEVSFSVGGVATSFHVHNDQMVKNIATTLDQSNFLQTLDVTMGNGLVHIQMTGTPAGSPPVASFTPQQSAFECTCKECTPVTFTSTSTDVDQDLSSLSWLLDGQVQPADGTSAPPSLSMQMPLGPHTVGLVASDTRGAESAASLPFAVVDTTPPVVTPPPNLQLTTCSFPDIGRATAVDACSDTVVVCGDGSGNYPVGTTTVTWTGEDESLNDATATQTVTVTNVADLRTCCPAGYNIILVPPGNPGVVNGTDGNDCIIGTSNNDVINGMGGDDIIFGLGGQDTINGGPGNDIIFGGDGDDIIDGGDGDDKIAGGTGQDRITGGAGNDIIIGGDGDDIIDGGDGDDIIYGNQGQDHITGGPGNDFIDGGFGDDQITGGATPATGNAGDDVIVGCFDNDTITDTVGNNTIEGFSGDDHLTGGPGNDTILGGKGHNTCVGGGGTDILNFCNN
jgi:hypothetical protein